MHDVHLLFGYPLCQIMQEQLFFQLAHEWIGGCYGFFQRQTFFTWFDMQADNICIVFWGSLGSVVIMYSTVH